MKDWKKAYKILNPSGKAQKTLKAAYTIYCVV